MPRYDNIPRPPILNPIYNNNPLIRNPNVLRPMQNNMNPMMRNFRINNKKKEGLIDSAKNKFIDWLMK
jgi:hypothetical protein